MQAIAQCQCVLGAIAAADIQAVVDQLVLAALQRGRHGLRSQPPLVLEQIAVQTCVGFIDTGLGLVEIA
jgi:hypothetical protein